MKAITIKRVFENDRRTYGVVGAFMEDGREEAFAVTLELPWVQNKNNISRIPAGQYRGEIYKSPSRKGALVILLKGVRGRQNVEVHVGNSTTDTKGCLLAGEMYEWVETSAGRVRGILSSKHAMQELLDYLKGEKEVMVVILDKF